jgi:hypothetical protein
VSGVEWVADFVFEQFGGYHLSTARRQLATYQQI